MAISQRSHRRRARAAHDAPPATPPTMRMRFLRFIETSSGKRTPFQTAPPPGASASRAREQGGTLTPPSAQRVALPYAVYDAITDPKRLDDTVPRGVTASSVLPAVLPRIIAFQNSQIRQPPIPFGKPERHTPPKRSD
jgi:hypothetical protein